MFISYITFYTQLTELFLDFNENLFHLLIKEFIFANVISQVNQPTQLNLILAKL